MNVANTDVIVVGGGPNGLMLAGELALAGVRPTVLERLSTVDATPKANAIIGQVARLLEVRGLHARLSGSSDPVRASPMFQFGAIPLHLARLQDNPVHGIRVGQQRLETVLGERARELGVRILRGHELTRLRQDGRAVTVGGTSPDGDFALRAAYLVGCDGGHSTVRELAGIDFPGTTTSDVVSRTAHAVIPGAHLVPGVPQLEVPGGLRLGLYAWNRTDHGAYALLPHTDELLTVSSVEWHGPPDEPGQPVTVAEVEQSLERVLGARVPLAAPRTPGPHLLRRLAGRNTRIAEDYRRGRVLLAGDAAHVHSAVGAPGLNLGLQDTVNLAWKLAAEVAGRAPHGLLDTYQDERRPAAERVAVHSQAQTALLAPGDGVTAVRTLLGELLEDEPALRRIADVLAGADIRYSADPPRGDLAAEALTGRFLPALSLDTGAQGLAAALRRARPVLLDATADDRLRELAQPWCDRVRYVRAGGAALAARALVIRPDGYVAWATSRNHLDQEAGDTLERALTRWFGAGDG